MARDESIKSVLVIGSGPIVIGQACELMQRLVFIRLELWRSIKLG